MLRHLIVLIIPVLFFALPASAQTLTGAWKGKINNTKVELKLIKSGERRVTRVEKVKNRIQILNPNS